MQWIQVSLKAKSLTKISSKIKWLINKPRIMINLLIK